MIFTAVSVLIAAGWSALFIRAYRTLGNNLCQPEHRALLVALVWGSSHFDRTAVARHGMVSATNSV
jgi:hypothetical protein